MLSAVRARRVEATAVLVGALAATVVVLAAYGSSDRNAAPHRIAARKRHPYASAARPVSSDTRAAAVAASTTYLVALGSSAVGNPDAVRSVVDSMTGGPLRKQLDPGLPALAASLRARVRRLREPAAFDGWPLGYRVVAFTRSAATVEIWHLDVGASSALGLMSAGYATTTYGVRFDDGTWRINHAATSPGPTPPSPAAAARDVERFARAVSAFAAYRYVP